MEINDSDLESVLKKDGVSEGIIDDLENLSTTNVDELRQRMGLGSWAARLVYNERFGGVIIQQQHRVGALRQSVFDANIVAARKAQIAIVA